MSKQHDRNPKPPIDRYMSTGVYQPMSIKEFTLQYIDSENNSRGTLRIIAHMFARLLVVLVGRKILNAPDFYYIMIGAWIGDVQFSDWSPEQELEEGLQPGAILNR